MKKGSLFFIILLSGLVLSCSKCKINSADDLFDEIYNRYNGNWFTHLSFSQTAQFIENGEVADVQRWIEEYKYPGNLIIKINYKNSQDGYLFRNDSVYVFEEGEITLAQNQIHDLLVLSKDIYNMPREEINNRLKQMNYDTEKFYTSKYNNRKAYVVGADPGDYSTNQFWYDAEELYLLRVIRNIDKGVQEIIFDNYIEVAGNLGWIEQYVEFKLNGETYLIEKYYDIKVPEIPISSFDNNNAAKSFSFYGIPKSLNIVSTEDIINTSRRIAIYLFYNF